MGLRSRRGASAMTALQIQTGENWQNVAEGSIMYRMFRGWNERRQVIGKPMLSYQNAAFVPVGNIADARIYAGANLQNVNFWNTLLDRDNLQNTSVPANFFRLPENGIDYNNESIFTPSGAGKPTFPYWSVRESVWNILGFQGPYSIRAGDIIGVFLINTLLRFLYEHQNVGNFLPPTSGTFRSGTVGGGTGPGGTRCAAYSNIQLNWGLSRGSGSLAQAGNSYRTAADFTNRGNAEQWNIDANERLSTINEFVFDNNIRQWTRLYYQIGNVSQVTPLNEFFNLVSGSTPFAYYRVQDGVVAGNSVSFSPINTILGLPSAHTFPPDVLGMSCSFTGRRIFDAGNPFVVSSYTFADLPDN
jgi:hypothetical protein